MFFHWIRIIFGNKYAELFYFERKNLGKGAVNPLDWSKTCKPNTPDPYFTQIRNTPTRILPKSVYTQTIFNLPIRVDRSDDEFEMKDLGATKEIVGMEIHMHRVAG